MTNDELNKAKAFLNKKEVPTPDDIFNLFFFDNKDEIAETGVNIDPNDINFELLGEANDIRTEKGTEWVVTRLLWETDEGNICRINLVKIGDELKVDDGYSINPFYPPLKAEHQQLENIKPLTYHELLDEAIKYENFEEAARLRDWDKGLKKLLFAIKPKIIKAIEDEDVIALDELLTQIRGYRKTLWKL